MKNCCGPENPRLHRHLPSLEELRNWIGMAIRVRATCDRRCSPLGGSIRPPCSKVSTYYVSNAAIYRPRRIYLNFGIADRPDERKAFHRSAPRDRDVSLAGGKCPVVEIHSRIFERKALRLMDRDRPGMNYGQLRIRTNNRSGNPSTRLIPLISNLLPGKALDFDARTHIEPHSHSIWCKTHRPFRPSHSPSAFLDRFERP